MTTRKAWHLAIAAALMMLLPASAQAATISGKVVFRAKKYLKNAVVYIAQAKGKFKPHTKVMNQKNQKFQPKVLPVVKGATVKFLNEDNTKHNVFSPDHEKYNLGTWPKGQTKSYTFKHAGVYTQLCKMHPSMLGYIVVLQNPMYAVTRADGSFTIKNVPPGKYNVAVWSERLRADKTPVKVSGKGVKGLAIHLKH